MINNDFVVFTLLSSLKRLQNVTFRAIYRVPLCATILDPLTRTTVHGIGEKLVENLLVFFV